MTRQARMQDADSIARLMLDHPLWQQYQLSFEGQRERLLLLISQHKAFVYCEVAPCGAEEVQGFIVFDTNTFGNCGYVQLVGVRHTETGRGIGAALMTYAHRQMIETTHKSFLLCTSTNGDAQRFYTRMGYRKVGELEGWVKPGITEYIFANDDIRTGLTALD